MAITPLENGFKSGEVDQDTSFEQEKRVIKTLKDYDKGKGKVDKVLKINHYDTLINGKCKHLEGYKESLRINPGKNVNVSLQKNGNSHRDIQRRRKKQKPWISAKSLNKFYKRFDKRRKNGSKT